MGDTATVGEYIITGMVCQHCVSAVTQEVAGIDGVTDVHVDLDTGRLQVTSTRPLDAAASAALSGSGDYGPQLLVEKPSTLPSTVLNFFLDYATPGYTQEGPTAAVYNHGWLIGDASAISVGVQAEVDKLLEGVFESSKWTG